MTKTKSKRVFLTLMCLLFLNSSLVIGICIVPSYNSPPQVEVSSHTEGQEVQGSEILLEWEVTRVGSWWPDYIIGFTLKGPENETLIDEDYSEDLKEVGELPSSVTYNFEENNFTKKETDETIVFTFLIEYYGATEEGDNSTEDMIEGTETIETHTFELNWVGLNPRSKFIRFLDQYKFIIGGIAVIGVVGIFLILKRFR